MIAIPCHNCNHMIHIDVSVEPIKVEELSRVPCYLLLCQSCQIQAKINERNIKLNKVLKRGLRERIKVWLK